ncbi:hypothetical protein [Shouchella patagoniensis]|uniref:hypothetical protein n=1 Tax=Shouchella patagoniensis TaxID=228576 RepID=UPI00099589FC|nr:hypothetical protein [Shouchella patagoniensis]
MTHNRWLDAFIAFIVVSAGSFLGILAIEGGNYSFADNWLRHALYGLGSALFFAFIFPLFIKRKEAKR